MTFNLSYMLFTSSLLLGTLITISAKSWFMMWVGLEMNMLSFIPMMNKNNTPYESESSMKYFMVQAMASMILMMSLLMSGITDIEQSVMSTIFLTAMFIKMGAAPMHMWFPAVMQGLSWANCMWLMTWQKVAPMVMMSYQMTAGVMTNIMITTSVIVGAVGGLNQTSIHKIMAYSSISHLGWMMLAMMMSQMYWVMYWGIYSILSATVVMLMANSSLFYLSQIFYVKMNNKEKFSLFMSILSLGGLPPFLGFLPKWMIIQNSVQFDNKMLIMIMVMTTMITLYFYLRMTYSAFTLSSQTYVWGTQNNNKMIIYMSIVISLMGLPIVTMINMY